MFELPSFADFNLDVALPAVSLIVGACIVLLIDLFLPEERKKWTPILAALGLVASFILNLLVYNTENPSAFGGMFVADQLTGFLNIVVLITAFITVMLSADYLNRIGVHRGEFYIFLLVSVAGAMFMISANNLIVMFIALELLSIPLYILSAFRAPTSAPNQAALKSEESGLKYFILGAFAGAFFVYGAALVYGATGTADLNQIMQAVPGIVAGGVSAPTFLLLTGAALIFVGLAFKVAAVPFHMWTPDVYEGAPTPITAFMSVAAKIGGFAAIFRFFVAALAAFSVGEGVDKAAWQDTVSLIAALTLILGNFVAISQSNIKRMLAYSSIAHAGYILMAVAAAGTFSLGDVAVRAGLIYLLAYMFTNMGAFAVVIGIEKNDGSGTDLSDFNGLAKSKPLMAAAMAVFMLSLTGIPLTAGFVGKLLIFEAAVRANLMPLVLVGVLTTVVSAYYYVRVIVNMYLNVDADGDAADGATDYVRWAVYASVAGTLALGIIFPIATSLVETITLVS